MWRSPEQLIFRSYFQPRSKFKLMLSKYIIRVYIYTRTKNQPSSSEFLPNSDQAGGKVPGMKSETLSVINQARTSSLVICNLKLLSVKYQLLFLADVRGIISFVLLASKTRNPTTTLRALNATRGCERRRALSVSRTIENGDCLRCSCGVHETRNTSKDYKCRVHAAGSASSQRNATRSFLLPWTRRT